jgi:ubiquinone/menaquinone biosynthesis C-methylase UbiE
MLQSVRRTRSERELHDHAAEAESHDDQYTGVVGFFNRRVRDYVIGRVGALNGRDLLEVGCGEGHMFAATDIRPVQMDVSMMRLRRAAPLSRWLVCGDGYSLPFRSETFRMVLLAAVLEHTREPWRVLAEARRVLKPGGEVVIVVPNDVTMSAGRLVLRKFPIRYPDHLTFATPRRVRRWLSDAFRVSEAFHLPIRQLPFAVNLYHIVVAERT